MSGGQHVVPNQGVTRVIKETTTTTGNNVIGNNLNQGVNTVVTNPVNKVVTHGTSNLVNTNVVDGGNVVRNNVGNVIKETTHTTTRNLHS